jgi:hypothetical protein
MKPLSLGIVVWHLLAGLVACGDKTAGTCRLACLRPSPAFMGGAQGGAYVSPGWKAGDKASWEEKMRSRTQAGQNEYPRAKGSS